MAETIIQGAIVTNAGRALLNKLLAIGAPLTIARASVGDGAAAPDPYALTELVSEVMDGTFARYANPGNGECTVTVQVSSIGVSVGFYITEVGIFASDPDTGLEVLLAYVPLDPPQWLRPADSAINNIVSFDVVVAIGQVEQVNITISPSSLVSWEVFRDYAVRADAISNRIYEGVDLTVAFAEEISQHSDVWAWIQARAQEGDYRGLYIGDYIPFTADGNVVKAEIVGIDTYRNSGNVPVGHHIDFISKDCWPIPHAFNKANYNNGTSVSPSPWLSSDLHAWLDSLAMNVPNAATANPALVAVNYANTGVFDKLPSELQEVIVPKHIYTPNRYTSGSLLREDNGWARVEAGKLWLPSEVEICGCIMHGTQLSGNAYSGAGYVQYPLFSEGMRRIKGAGDGGERTSWWLSTVSGDSSTDCVRSDHFGGINRVVASGTTIYVPVCFRIA